MSSGLEVLGPCTRSRAALRNVIPHVVECLLFPGFLCSLLLGLS
jgi:hypothetical protein